MLINADEQVFNILEKSFLAPILEQESITDISFNGTQLYVQDNIKGRSLAEHQPTKEEVFTLGKRIADLQGKEFAVNEPILDTELSYLRVNFVHPVVSPSGTTFSIRISKPRLAIQDIDGLANQDVSKLLEVLIRADMNVIISGQTGSGKTEVQKLLVNFIDEDRKITLIEDTQDSHIKELYPNMDINSWRTLSDQSRANKVDYRKLIKAGLRNNPNWLIIAETRGDEAYDMLESALTDHSIITTIHATEAKKIPSRLLGMIGQKYQVNELLIGKDIADTLKIGIYMGIKMTEEGIKRFIREIVEFTDFTDRGVTCNTIYQVKKRFNPTTRLYEEYCETKPLSDKTLDNLHYKEVYHELPEAYKQGETEGAMSSAVSV